MEVGEPPATSNHGLLWRVVGSALQQRYGSSAKVIRLSTEDHKGDGHSGNEFHIARVTWDAGEHHTGKFFLKKWSPDGATAALMGATSSSESLLRESRLYDMMSESIAIPIVGSFPMEDGDVWIVMDDVSNELIATKRIASDAATKPVLDLMAHTLAAWSSRVEFSDLREYPWLLPQDKRLWCNAVAFASLLGVEPSANAPVYEGRRPLHELLPVSFEEASRTIKTFVSAVPAKYRKFWIHHMIDRSDLIDCFAEFPRSLIHGDTVPENVGICKTGDRLVMIDWEWVGEGTPVFDAHHFLRGFMREFDDFVSDAYPRQEPLRRFFFGKYVEYGGSGYSEAQWNAAWDAVLVWDSVTWFPVYGGRAIKNGSTSRDVINRKIETLTDSLLRVLG